MATRRLVVIGADAAGMSAAHQAIRTARTHGNDLEVVALERTDHTSYSACGIPYWLAGDVDSPDDLVARTPEGHRERGVDLRMRHEVTAIDTDNRHVTVRNLDSDPNSSRDTDNDTDGATEYRLDYDELLIATGAEPIHPDWARGIPGVLPVKTLDDGAAWQGLLADNPATAVVVGGGYIGMEVAETFARLGITTTLVTRGAQPMAQSFEPHMGALIRKGLEDAGVTVVPGTDVTGITEAPAGSGARLQVTAADGSAYPADVVALALGVRPRTQLAKDAGLRLGERGGLVPDAQQRVADGVWAAGDCCEVFDRILNSHWYIPLGTHANRAGRVAGTVIGGGEAHFPGVLGTAILRAGHAEVSRVGLRTDWLPQLGLTDADVITTTMESTTASGYMPESAPMAIWVMAERATGRLLGCQIVGGRGAAKRIDTAATAMWNDMTVGDIALMDLSYAPPFSPVWDPVQIACRRLADQLR